MAHDLGEIVNYRKAQAGHSAKKEVQKMVMEAIEEDKPAKEIIVDLKEAMSKNNGIQEHDAIIMVNICYTFLTLLNTYRG